MNANAIFIKLGKANMITMKQLWRSQFNFCLALCGMTSPPQSQVQMYCTDFFF